MRFVKYIAAFLAAAMLFAGCGTAAGTAGGSQPQAVQQECNLPRDGKLRVFYGQSNEVVFCGNKIVFEAGPAESVSLLTDAYTKETDYFVVGTPVEKSRYEYTVYTANGELYYACGEMSYFGLMDGWLVLAETDVEDWYDEVEVSEVRLVHLASGKTKTLEENTAYFNVVGDYYAACRWDYSGPDEESDCHVNLYDHDWVMVQHLDGYLAVQTTELGKDWLYFTGDEIANALFNVATGEWLEDVTLCGGSVYAQPVEYGNYAAYDINTRQQLGVYGGVGRYLEDGMVYWNEYGNWMYPGQYYLLETVDENGGFVQAVNKVTNYLENDREMCALRLVDEIRLYDTDGSLIFAQPFDELQEGQRDDCYYEPVAQEKAILVQRYGEADANTWARPVLEYRLLDADGVRWTLTGEDAARYTSIYNWTDTDFLLGTRAGTEYNTASLYDILSAKDGSVLISGVTNVGFMEAEIIKCRRGFEEGAMDLNGQWLWHRSIWQSVSDDTGSGYYW